MPKIWPSQIFEEFFFRPEMPEICRKSPFLQIFIGLFPYILLFFRKETLFITLPTIKYGSNVTKTDFCSRNSLKVAGTADFRRKNGISWISRAVLNIFSWNLAHWCKMIISKMWRRPIFEKHIFQVENAGNMPDTGLLAFFRYFIICFFWFFAQRRVLAMPKTWPSPIFKKKFFPAENAGNMPEIAVFADFHWTFSLYFVVFSLKNIIK